MKVVAIISEYNPFHNGHLYQINKIRETFGEDTAIISIMSGNYVQRADIAIMDKWSRAKTAVKCGVNLVLELPFPYSMSSAEFFARAGVYIADRINIVDILSFGSESGSMETLSKIAYNMSSLELENEFSRLSSDACMKDYGYAALRTIAYKNIFGDSESISTPNNILAIEYIKAIHAFNSKIIPHTIKRIGENYRSEIIGTNALQSATAIRNEIKSNHLSAAKFIPELSQNIISDNFNSDAFPCLSERISTAIISHFRLSPSCVDQSIHDANGGLYNRIRSKSFDASDFSSLIELSKTKKYTTARIVRAIWYSFFGVTSSDVKTTPEYTQILAMDKIGQALLRKIKKSSDFVILTKPSDIPENDFVIRQKKLSDMADSIFELTKPKPLPGSSIYKRRPFIECE